MAKSLAEVFNFYKVDPSTGCWNWTRAKRKGYGVISFNGRQYAAHRASYEVANGGIPNGLHICHSCDNPACINPSHLFAGTHKDNMLDKETKGRGNHYTPRGDGNSNSIISDANVVALIKDYIRGLSHANLAEKYGVSVRSVPDYISGKSRSYLFGQGDCPTLAEVKAARNLTPGAKLSADAVRDIKRRLAAGDMGKDIAADFGIHKATVSDIKLGKIWKDVFDGSAHEQSPV